MKTYLSKYTRSAIIGMHLNGTTPEKISVELDIKYDKVVAVIETYFRKKLSSTMDAGESNTLQNTKQ
jgi:hypothetical protein